MSIPYDVFVGAFLSKISEYDFSKMEEFDRNEIVNGYMKKSLAQFNGICKYNMMDYDDIIRQINTDIPDNEIDEIIDIVSEGMLVQWMKPFVYRQENLQNVLNTRDFTTYSPAELLLRINNAYAKVQRDHVNMMREYSYRHGDLTDLHL